MKASEVNIPQDACLQTKRGWQDAFAIVRELAALICVFLIWMASQSALAEEGESAVEKGFSSLWLRSVIDPIEDAGFDALGLDTTVDIQVTGPIARVSVKQSFVNPSQLWAEGEYRYPLPENAAVDRLRLWIGDRVIEGQIQEKQQAIRRFEQARTEGKKASLLSNRRTNQFSTQVTNIAPQEKVVVEFEYQQWLDFKEGGYRLRFPMVSTPSYTPAVTGGSLATLSPHFVAPDNNFRAIGEVPGNPVQISVDIETGVPASMPQSASHEIEVKQLSATRYAVLLKGDANESNRDFLLSWKAAPAESPLVSVLREKQDDGDYGLLMIMPPQETLDTDFVMQRELVLVLDVSGSMQGESINQAKSALLKALEELDGHNLFNLLWFNNTSFSLFPVSQPANARNLSLARHKIMSLNADGGTNMLPAMAKALNKRSAHAEPSNILRQVIFMTDGAVSNEAELFTTIQQNLGHSRLFTVGIGSAPNSYFMRKAARAGRGTFTYVSRPEEVNQKIASLFRVLRAPSLTNVDLDFQGYSLELFPKPLPDLYLGEPIYAVFKADEFPEYLTLSGRLNGAPSYIRLALDDSNGTKVAKGNASESDGDAEQYKNTGVASEWARRKIEHLTERYREGEGKNKESIKKEMIELAVKHRQVTKYTSLVAVDVTPARAGGQLNKTRIPSNLPEGWALTSSQAMSIPLAQTSAGLWVSVITGVIAIVLAVCLLLLRLFMRDSVNRLPAGSSSLEKEVVC